MRNTLVLIVVGTLGLGTLAGCYDEPGATVYEPGEYKGTKDPLLAKQRDAGHQKRLEERFAMVQIDR